MMIERVIRLVHCSDGRIKKELLLSGPVSEEFFRYCSDFGEVRVIGGLKKVFFTFLIPECLNARGFLGESTLEVWFFPEYVVDGETFLWALVSGFGSRHALGNAREAHQILVARVATGRQ